MLYVGTAKNGVKYAVLNLQGRVFLPAIDDPFRKADAELAKLPADVAFVLVDMHAETTSEKIAMGWYLDGRVTAVVGTHTHVTTADEHVLPQGTAFITDVGMTGPHDGVIGMDRDGIIKRFLDGLPARFDVASRRRADELRADRDRRRRAAQCRRPAAGPVHRAAALAQRLTSLGIAAASSLEQPACCNAEQPCVRPIVI